MKRTILTVAALGVVLTVPALVATAGPDKVEVCHVTGEGSYMLINVSSASLDAHFDHGDGQPGVGDFDAECNLVTEPPEPEALVFARAYVDRGTAGAFDPKTDVLIAEWRDGGDLALGGDDTVVANEYPLNFSGAPVGVFGVTNVDVAAVLVNAPDQCVVSTGGGNVTAWLGGADSEFFLDQGPVVTSSLRDYKAPIAEDTIDVVTTSPLLPDTAVSLSQESPSDDSFLQVELNCAP